MAAAGTARARKGAGARPLLCTQGPRPLLGWRVSLAQAPDRPELEGAICPELAPAPAGPQDWQCRGSGTVLGTTLSTKLLLLNSICILHITKTTGFPQMLLCTHYVWQIPSLHLLPGVRRALKGRANLGLHLSFAIYKVRPGVASPLSVPQSPPL